jgi:hypothetical protein
MPYAPSESNRNRRGRRRRRISVHVVKHDIFKSAKAQ